MVNGPGENLSVPVGNVPKVLWLDGEQWRPTRVSTEYLSQRLEAISAMSFLEDVIEITEVRGPSRGAPTNWMPGISLKPV